MIGACFEFNLEGDGTSTQSAPSDLITQSSPPAFFRVGSIAGQAFDVGEYLHCQLNIAEIS